MNINSDVYTSLIRSYKNAKNLITQTPDIKEQIIKEYIDLVLKLSLNRNQFNDTDASIDMNASNYNPVPADISIYNTFNSDPYNKDNNDNRDDRDTSYSYIDITRNSRQSLQELASTYNYLNI